MGMKLATDMSVDTGIVVDRLRAAKTGELVAYADLAALIGRDVTGRARYVLTSARRALLREGIAFGAVTGKGLQRLDDEGKVGTIADGIGRIRHTAAKTARVLASVENYAALPQPLQARHNMGLSVCGAVKLMTSAPRMKQLQEVVADKRAAMAAREALKLFAHE